jgi:enoyl-CoA hydratase/carnithine racemase
MQYAGPDGTLAPMQFIRANLDEGILTIALHRPGQRNAVDVALALEMQALLQAVHHDADVRVVVLRGEGAGFCAGLDTADFFDTTHRDEGTLRAAREAANDWRVRRLRLLPHPVIAMVHGFCEGGAVAILEGCDIVLAADDTAFSLPDRDGNPDGASARSMSRVMTQRAASYYALTGGTFDGKEAERNGLVSRSVAPAELEQETYALARDFVAKDAIALQFTKETLLHVGDMSWDGALNFTAAKFAELKTLQAGRPSARAAAVASFLAGKSKPGLGA